MSKEEGNSEEPKQPDYDEKDSSNKQGKQEEKKGEILTETTNQVF